MGMVVALRSPGARPASTASAVESKNRAIALLVQRLVSGVMCIPFVEPRVEPRSDGPERDGSLATGPSSIPNVSSSIVRFKKNPHAGRKDHRPGAARYPDRVAFRLLHRYARWLHGVMRLP